MKFIKQTISAGIADGKNVNEELRKEFDDYVLEEFGSDRSIVFGVPREYFDIVTVGEEGEPEIVRFYARTYYGVVLKHS